MSTHKMELDNGHIILVDNGKRFIVDTGASFSVADGLYKLNIAGEEYTVSSEAPVSLNEITGMGLLSNPVNGLLGLNILNNGKSWEFDFKNQVIYVGEPVKDTYSDSIPYKTNSATGFTFKVKVNGNVCNCLIDTGAFVSYASSTLIGTAPVCGTIDDCNPIIGKIHTTKHEVQIMIGNKSFEQQVGKMPQILEATMAMAGMLGVPNLQLVMGITPLGLDAFCLNAQNNTLMI